MTQAEVETELQAVSAQLKQLVEQQQSRETEWRKLGLIARISGIVSSLVGAGFIVSNLLVAGGGANFHTQMTMMGIVFIVVSTPLVLLGQALHRGGRASFVIRLRAPGSS